MMTAHCPPRLIRLICKVTGDDRLNTSDMSIYLALIACWGQQEYRKRFTISRREVMKLAKIAAISTYHRSLKKLITLGYIIYEPTYDSYTGTKIILIG